MAGGYIRRGSIHSTPSLVQILLSAMDVDWCLSCERKLVCPPPRTPSSAHPIQDDVPSHSGPYCSTECLSYAQPPNSTSTFILPDQGAFRIHQWARAIPPHVPAGAPALPFDDLPPFLQSERPPSPRPRLQPTPKLIERTAACTPLPTLCISSSAHVRPPPVRALSHTYSQPTTSTMSEASTSLSSLLSEPLVATPDEDTTFGANIGALVRWVSRDRANSTRSTVQDCVIEKVTDYFPPLPHPKRTPPSSSKKLKPSQPRPKFASKKAVAPPDRDHSTPTHSHTPTPVIFPSCRAWVEDEDQVREELLVAPQPQYHPCYYQPKCASPHVESVYRMRAPSPSSSISSSDSSILLMVRKRTDGLRGRKGGKVIAA